MASAGHHETLELDLKNTSQGENAYSMYSKVVISSTWNNDTLDEKDWDFENDNVIRLKTDKNICCKSEGRKATKKSGQKSKKFFQVCLENLSLL